MNKPLTIVTARPAPLLRDNINTDAILPSREFRQLSRVGLGKRLFAEWRFEENGSGKPRPDFILNHEAFHNTAILLSGENFGCGSSREFAVWALQDFGIKVIIAQSFGGIFRANCTRNGILTVTLDAPLIAKLADHAQQTTAQMVVNLENSSITYGDDINCRFVIDETMRQRLLTGADEISETLDEAAAIDRFIKHDKQQRPWLYKGAV